MAPFRSIPFAAFPALALAACGGSSNGLPTCTYMTLNAPLQGCDAYGASYRNCNPCSGGASCVAAPVTGDASCSGTSENFDSTYTLCAVPCSKDSDCTSLDFLAANGNSMSGQSCPEAATTQTWSCQSFSGTSYCAVVLTPNGTGPTACQNCLSACQGISGCCTGSGCMCCTSCGGTGC